MTWFLSNRCRWRQGTAENLGDSIAHRTAARVVDAREALVSVFELKRCWIRAKDRTVKSRRDYSRSPQNNINRECGAGTICFERGRESRGNPRVEIDRVRFTGAVTNARFSFVSRVAGSSPSPSRPHPFYFASQYCCLTASLLPLS